MIITLVSPFGAGSVYHPTPLPSTPRGAQLVLTADVNSTVQVDPSQINLLELLSVGFTTSPGGLVILATGNAYPAAAAMQVGGTAPILH